MSEELKPCPFCGGPASEAMWPGHVGCLNSDCGAYKANLSIAAWNRRASPTPPTTEGREKAMEDAQRIVAWDDNGRLADDEWLVERNETAIIAICRALLSSPRVEEKSPIAGYDQPGKSHYCVDCNKSWHGDIAPCTDKTCPFRSLSPPDGDGKQEQATRASGPTAPSA